MKLTYKAISQNGAVAQGIIDAKDVSEAASYLRSRQLTPIKIGTGSQSLANLFSFKKKAGMKDVIFFTRQLSSMLVAGLTLMQALLILKKQFKDSAMKDVVNDVITQVEEGHALSDALTKHPKVFSEVYISLIKAAEEGGLMDKVLLRLADNLEKQEKLRSTIKSALIYPIIVIILMIAVMFIMMLFVIPPMSELYKGLNVEIPLPTQIILWISNFFVHFWPVIIGGIFLGIFGFRKWYAMEKGKRLVDTTVLKVPIFGKIIIESTIAEFTRTFGLLVGTGTLIVEALDKSSHVVNNILFVEAIDGVKKRVEKGISVGDAMTFSPLFPTIVVEMTKIGEQTGKLDDSLIRVSEYFEREVDLMVKNLTTLMEPFIIVTLGAGIGALIYAIIIPLYGVITSIK